MYSIESVTGTSARGTAPIEFSPFYSHRHHYAGEPERPPLYWTATRRTSSPSDDSMLWLSFHDLSSAKRLPDADTVTVRCLCTNGGVPHRFSAGGSPIDLTPVSTGPVRGAGLIRKPTAYIEPRLDGSTLWRLVSHLSLSSLSLAEDAEPLREMLRLHASGSAGAGQQISGLRSVQCARRFARVASDEGIAFARGIGVSVSIDEEAFTGASAFLFASVLERFFASYVAVNSFSQTAAFSSQRKEPIRAWPPRTGSIILI